MTKTKPIVRLRLSERTVQRTPREGTKTQTVTVYTVKAKARHEALRIGDCTVGRRDPSICHPMHVPWIGGSPNYAGHIDIDLIDYDWTTKTQTIDRHTAICYGDTAAQVVDRLQAAACDFAERRGIQVPGPLR